MVTTVCGSSEYLPTLLALSIAQDQFALRLSRRGRAHARESKQIGQACRASTPFVEYRLTDQRVVPGTLVALFGWQRIDSFAPCGGGAQLALHIGMACLLLCLGFDEIDRLARAHQEVGNVEPLHAVVLHVTQAR